MAVVNSANIAKKNSCAFLDDDHVRINAVEYCQVYKVVEEDSTIEIYMSRQSKSTDLNDLTFRSLLFD